MRIKTILLAIVTVITFGLTSCTEEFGGDNTQGKPGYLTINVQTLKPSQSKYTGNGSTTSGTVTTHDYQTIKNLNIFVFSGDEDTSEIILHKYSNNGDLNLNIPVPTLTVGAKVVVVANYGADMMGVTNLDLTTLGGLKAVKIETVREFSANGLHMTGIADIRKVEAETGGTETPTLPLGSYESVVKIAPVESKITVNYDLSTFVAKHYNITGIYIVNAVGLTTLPIIREHKCSTNHVWNTPTDRIINNAIHPTPMVTYTGFPKVGSITIDGVEKQLFANNGITIHAESHELLTNSILQNATDGTSSIDTGAHHFYVGENYHNNANGKTIVLIRATPKIAAGTAPVNQVRYYTYELSESSADINKYPGTDSSFNLTNATTDPIKDGFSTRRKVNYQLKFNLNALGTLLPFEKTNTLNVDVQAEGWQDAAGGQTF